MKRNWPVISTALALVLDAGLAYLSVGITWSVLFDVIRVSHPITRATYGLRLTAPVVYLAILVILGCHSKLFRRPPTEQVLAICKGALYGLLITGLWVFLSKGYDYSRGFILAYFLIAPLILSLGRLPMVAANIALVRRGWGKRRSVIIGTSGADVQIFDQLAENHALGYEIEGFLVEEESDQDFAYGGVRAIGLRPDFGRIAPELQLEQAFISELPVDHMDIFQTCRDQGMGLNIVSERVDLLLRAARIADAAGVSVVRSREDFWFRMGMAGKRLFDFVAALAGLMAAGPFFLLIMALIRLDSRGPAIFRQERRGGHGQRFTMFKFRTMHQGSEARQAALSHHNESDGPIFKIKRDPRITRVGWYLRRFSLDELPQLANVLRGDMSLVGPRPPLGVEVEQYLEWHQTRLDGPLGMTGLWQVSGRSKLRFDEMVLLDLYYLNNWTPLLDLRIILKSIPAVILGKGAY